MATNKHAIIRYHALDRCFGNPGRKFFIENLIAACNDALFEATGVDNGVKRRQVLNDIKFMESEAGWSIPLERRREGRRVSFRYTSPSFSIRGESVNVAEVEQISETLAILSRFSGRPQFEWLEEIQVRLASTFQVANDSTAVVSFQENPYLIGLRYFSELFTAITQKQVLSITYQGFTQNVASALEFHPWLLKQYNDRWFVLGYNAVFGGVSTLALDRIGSIEASEGTYRENAVIDLSEYFEDVVGVSIPEERAVERIVISIDRRLWPYIESKPLHGSQKVIERRETAVVVELQLIVNYELRSVLLSYLRGIEVAKPTWLREAIKMDLEVALKRYI
ncbi:helix-turn-helix transcriptional regulator [Neolewinella persica]|uniref:helix-turn-helix transcriptional regulator n=1 Tax=Neolewinella persica TaxID=70998 RepID=UPI000361AD40|nr:WYL domain-containing protein [Neolewinella persica]